MASLGSLESLRELNRLRVIDALRRRGTASRSELARATGLSRTTVATLVTELQVRGLVVEQPPPPGPAGRGRPPILLRLDPSAGAVVGIHFDHRHLRVAVADLASTVVVERLVELDVDHAAATALDAAAELVDAVLAEAGIERSHVVGAGMALSGPIALDGTVGSTVIMPGWYGLSASEELSSRLDLHVAVDNDANLGALAELSFGAGRGLADVIYVMVSSGIGAGIVIDGCLDRCPARAAAPRPRQRPGRPWARRAARRRRPRCAASRQGRRVRDRACARRSLQRPQPGGGDRRR